MVHRKGNSSGRRRKFAFTRPSASVILSAFWLSHASTTIPTHLTRAQELDTDLRFPLLDRNADGRLGGDELVGVDSPRELQQETQNSRAPIHTRLSTR